MSDDEKGKLIMNSSHVEIINNTTTTYDGNKITGRWIGGSLSVEELNELLALEYILTWGFTNNKDKDEKRYEYLSNKRWTSLGRN